MIKRRTIHVQSPRTSLNVPQPINLVRRQPHAIEHSSQAWKVQLLAVRPLRPSRLVRRRYPLHIRLHHLCKIVHSVYVYACNVR